MISMLAPGTHCSNFQFDFVMNSLKITLLVYKRSANKTFNKLDCKVHPSHKIFSQLCLLSLCSLILPVCDMKMNNFCKKSQTDIVEFIEISTNENEGSGTIDQLQV